MRIIDAHNHVCWHGHTPEKHVRNMDEFGIDVTLILTWEAPPQDRSPSFERVCDPTQNGLELASALEARRLFPDRFVVGYCPDPRDPMAIDRLEAALTIHDIRACGEWKYRMMFDNVDNLRLLTFCSQHTLPVTIHISYPAPLDKRGYPRPDYWYLGGMEALERAMQAVPEAVILGHGPGFWGTISADDKHLITGYPEGPIVPGGAVVRLMREFPNLYGDMSANSGLNALTRDRAFGKEFIIEFQDRILYARDYFDNRHREFMEGLDLPQDVFEKVMGGNAARLLRLDQ